MACPYFTPLEPLPWSRWRHEYRPPLGELFSGSCSALAGEPYEPPEDVLRESCNMGYARRRCPRIPPGDGPDAVRFAVASDSGGVVELRWAIESAHRPRAHGVLRYERSAGRWRENELEEPLLRQAEAYLSAYLRALARGAESS